MSVPFLGLFQSRNNFRSVEPVVGIALPTLSAEPEYDKITMKHSRMLEADLYLP